MKFFKLPFILVLAAVALSSCSGDDNGGQQAVEDTGSFSINDDTFVVPQAFLIFDGQETQSPYSYRLEFYSDEIVVTGNSISGTGDFAFIEFDSGVLFGSENEVYSFDINSSSGDIIDVYFLTNYNFNIDQGQFLQAVSGSMQVQRIDDSNVQVNYTFTGDFGESIEGSYRGSFTRVDDI
ncbi:MAG: hypothetical protein WBG46_00930 [Nonlabens sp.]